jgi:hypothetical protein
MTNLHCRLTKRTDSLNALLGHTPLKTTQRDMSALGAKSSRPASKEVLDQMLWGSNSQPVEAGRLLISEAQIGILQVGQVFLMGF